MRSVQRSARTRGGAAWMHEIASPARAATLPASRAGFAARNPVLARDAVPSARPRV
jgi:hypothetical protein